MHPHVCEHARWKRDKHTSTLPRVVSLFSFWDPLSLSSELFPSYSLIYWGQPVSDSVVKPVLLWNQFRFRGTNKMDSLLMGCKLCYCGSHLGDVSRCLCLRCYFSGLFNRTVFTWKLHKLRSYSHSKRWVRDCNKPGHRQQQWRPPTTIQQPSLTYGYSYA